MIMTKLQKQKLVTSKTNFLTLFEKMISCLLILLLVLKLPLIKANEL